MTYELSFRDALSTGWNITKSRFPLLLAFMATFLLLGGLRAFLGEKMESQMLNVIIGIGFNVFSWYLTFNALGISLKLIDSKPVEYADLWRPQNKFWFYVLATLLYGVITALGTLLLVVPGIILGLMFMFYGYVMIEKSLGPIEALQESKRLTQGVKMDLFLFSLLAIGLNLLGMLALLVGVFVTMIVTYLAIAHLYRQRTRALELTPAA
ncbi:MAG: hypothetical protein JNK54_00285 [Elusimicrobia bacterium]|nr:hypothetical protein [Elusimicrobiota bacterium]